MITWQHGERTFTYRVAAVIVDQNRVLLCRVENASFWFLPGGRVEFLEPAALALMREMREELGVEITIERLLWVVENFFTHCGHHHHELGLYFLASLPPAARWLREQEAFEGQENPSRAPDQRLYFQWIPLEAAQLGAVTIYPEFLQHGLIALPDQVVHIRNAHSL